MPDYERVAACAASSSRKRRSELPCLLMCPSRCRPCTGVFAGDQSQVAADLLAATKTLRRPDDQNIGQCRQWTNTGMRHESLRLRILFHLLLNRSR